jgi:hypothetical protein
MLNPNPTMRPHISDVYEHPWIAGAPDVADQDIIAEMTFLISLPLE